MLRSFSKALRKTLFVSRAQASTAAQKTLKEPDPKILSMVVCPLSKKPLIYSSQKRELISLEARVAYPIFEDGTVNLNPRNGRVIVNEQEFQELTADQQKNNDC